MAGRELSIDCNGVALSFAADTDQSYVGRWSSRCTRADAPTSLRIYLAVDKVDMRCGHDGLGAIVRTQWRLRA